MTKEQKKTIKFGLDLARLRCNYCGGDKKSCIELHRFFDIECSVLKAEKTLEESE